jgi:hypothetical protein
MWMDVIRVKRTELGRGHKGQKDSSLENAHPVRLPRPMNRRPSWKAAFEPSSSCFTRVLSGPLQMSLENLVQNFEDAFVSQLTCRPMRWPQPVTTSPYLRIQIINPELGSERWACPLIKLTLISSDAELGHRLVPFEFDISFSLWIALSLLIEVFFFFFFFFFFTWALSVWA